MRKKGISRCAVLLRLKSLFYGAPGEALLTAKQKQKGSNCKSVGPGENFSFFPILNPWGYEKKKKKKKGKKPLL